jgi:DNA-binding NarL/FixJ family response regulator
MQRASITLDASLWARVNGSLQLSNQQARIVAAILRGLCDKEIAAELHLSIPTVRTYMSRIFERLDVQDRVGVVLRVFTATLLCCDVIKSNDSNCNDINLDGL